MRLVCSREFSTPRDLDSHKRVPLLLGSGIQAAFPFPAMFFSPMRPTLYLTEVPAIPQTQPLPSKSGTEVQEGGLMPTGKYWTTKEDEVLVSSANKGARAVSDELRLLGSERSESAVISRAHVIGVSMARYDECPECRRPVKARSLNRVTGLCRVCSEKQLADDSRKRRMLAEQGAYTDEDERAIKRHMQKRWAERKAKERILEDEARKRESSQNGKQNSR